MLLADVFIDVVEIGSLGLISAYGGLCHPSVLYYFLNLLSLVAKSKLNKKAVGYC